MARQSPRLPWEHPRRKRQREATNLLLQSMLFRRRVVNRLPQNIIIPRRRISRKQLQKPGLRRRNILPLRRVTVTRTWLAEKRGPNHERSSGSETY